MNVLHDMFTGAALFSLFFASFGPIHAREDENEAPPRYFFDPDGSRSGLRIPITRISVGGSPPFLVGLAFENVTEEGIFFWSDSTEKEYGVRVWTPRGRRLDKSLPPEPDNEQHRIRRRGKRIPATVNPNKEIKARVNLSLVEMTKVREELPWVFQVIRYFENDPCALLSAPVLVMPDYGFEDLTAPEGLPPEPKPSEHDREIAHTLEFDLDGDLSGLRLVVENIRLDKEARTCSLSMALENVSDREMRVKGDDDGREYAVRFWTTRGHYLGGRTLPDPFPFEPKHEKGLEYVLAPGERVAAGEVRSDALDKAVFEQPVLAQVYRVVEQGPYVLISPPILIEPGDGVVDLSDRDKESVEGEGSTAPAP